MKDQAGAYTEYSRDVPDAGSLHSRDDFLGQLNTISNHTPDIISFPSTYDSSDLNSVDTRNIALQTLPSGDPASGGVGESDKSLVDLAGALLDGVFVAGQFEELVAVWAALATELGRGHDDAADHAGAQLAVLGRRDVAGHGSVGCCMS